MAEVNNMFIEISKVCEIWCYLFHKLGLMNWIYTVYIYVYKPEVYYPSTYQVWVILQQKFVFLDSYGFHYS